MSDQAPLKDRPQAKPGILDIHAYVPGKSKGPRPDMVPVKLSSNENILGCSPAAKAAAVAAAERLALYPDSTTRALREAVAAQFRLEPDRLLFGCGSDEIFALLNQTYLEPGDNIVMGQYGFAAYAIGAKACQAEVRYADEPGLVTHVDNMLALVDDRTRLVFFANPSNPTGTIISGAEIRRLHAGLRPDVILVVDGAYAEFCTEPGFEDGLDLARTAPNVVVTRTFSKLHGLAALRVGWAYAPAEIVAAVDRIRLPFNTSIAGQDAAIAALADTAFQQGSLDLVQTWRPWLTQQLGGLGLEVTPSQANFLLVRFPVAPDPRTAQAAEAYLAEHGYLVRGLTNYGLPGHLRITIGLEAHNRAVVDLLGAFMRGEA
ncbi:MAG TPA: histidinol-phosphate transaminase [Caulobacteraceae bacterium]|nr:histidinol-phosphate transaminase [Caulobacteraceae bacterium]